MEERIGERLAWKEPRRILGESLVKAAVLLPLYKEENEYFILFTKRSSMTKYHVGQVSFPGGAYKAGDGTLRFTALRETFEEIGVNPEDVRILGEMDDVTTVVSNYVVTPFVGGIPYPYVFTVNRNEVDELIRVPLSLFLSMNINEKYHYGGHVIWGATARILNQFLKLLMG